MDFLRQIKNRLQELEQQRLINIKSLQIWFILLIISFGSISWLWNRLIAEDDPTSHFPPGLLSRDVRKRLPAFGFTTERAARAFAIKEVEAAVIACRRDTDISDESAMDAVLMMKSAALLSKSVIHFHIYTEDILYSSFMRELDKWPAYIRHRVSFRFSHVTYPESLLGWKNLLRPCSSFKLFLPNVLKDFEFVIHVDSDSLFLNSLDSLWFSLTRFKPSQAIALSATRMSRSALSKFGIESFDIRAIVFDIFRLRHLIFQVPVAFNGREFSLQNMTWHPNMLHSIYRLFHNEITVPDQDILSILLHFNKDKFFMQSCQWTFRWEYCDEYLSWVKSRFLNATMKQWPLMEKKICPQAFMLHKYQSLSVEENREFTDVQRSWKSANFTNPKSGVIDHIMETVLRKQLPNQVCYRLNMELFIRSIRTSVRI